MIYINITHRVADFDKWLAAFNDFYPVRKEGGEIAATVYRSRKDPNEVTVINEWDTLDRAEKFFASPKLRDAMKKAGVLGKPTITYLDRALAA